MNYTKTQFELSNRLQNYEKEIIKYFETKKVYEIKKIQKNFKNRASLSTLKAIAKHSSSINYNSSVIFDASVKLAEISYTITGGNIDSILIGSDSGNLPNGTVYNAYLSEIYSFDIEVNNSPGNWSINITRVIVHGEGPRTAIQPAPTDESRLTVYTN